MSMKKMSEMDKRIHLHIGQRVRTLRITHGISQKKLGEILGVTFQQVQKYENGQNRITTDKLMILCAHFNMTMEQILNFDYVTQTGLQTSPDKGTSKLLKYFCAIEDDRLRGKSIKIMQVLAG